MEITIKGTPISTTETTQPLSSDLILIEQSGQFGDNRTTATNYDVLSSHIYNKLSSYMSIKSMAFRNSWEYSPNKHTHSQYNKVDIETIDNTIDDIYGLRRKNIVLGNLNVDGQDYTLYAPSPVINDAAKPKVGQLKFFYAQSLKPVDAYASNFDGWVFPDGKSYKSDDFPEAALVFGSVGGYFKVPTLSSFMYMCGNKNGGCDTETVPTQDVTPAHTHKIQNLYLTGFEKGTLSYPTGSNIKGTGGFHEYTGPTTQPVKTNYLSIYMTMTDIQVKNAGYINNNIDDEVEETLPSYTTLPVKIYIGDKQ